SFSTPDGIGHAFGPNSVEEQDIYLRLDLEFADFFNFLDSWVGKGQYTVFLSADHGVMDVPAFWQQHNLPAGVMEGNAISQAVKKAMQEAFGSDELIRASENYQLYLDHAALKKKKIAV